MEPGYSLATISTGARMIPRDIRNGCLTIVVMLVLWAVALWLLARFTP